MTVIEETKTPHAARSGDANGRIWGARAADWADIQQPQCAPAYHAVFDKAVIGAETRLLDAGCGAGLALQIAAELGASVAGVDASPALLEVAAKRLRGCRLNHRDL
ncbi:class I SAM-dependent methyltransferase [Maribius pontilimi]|uniref:Class I SAM-dependent methyltransferase n=1 Tax=Palleronia pontilimi TaxID=1964209 RepID=A0A934IF94_9RHOB|nr:class I SAM-dependent methyltransferase [Palleronia pontilimi]